MTDFKKYQPSAEQLEVGEVYEFSDCATEWFAGSLISIDNDADAPYPYESSYVWAKYIRKCQAQLGKIKPKPVELVDGEYYVFNLTDEIVLGEYEERNKGFSSDARFYSESKCHNIRRLKVVED